MKPCKVTRFICEYCCVNLFMYHAVRIFEVLISLLIEGYGVHNGIRLESFLEFSTISCIIALILSSCALKCEYSIRYDIRVQNEREWLRQMEKMEEGIELTEQKKDDD